MSASVFQEQSYRSLRKTKIGGCHYAGISRLYRIQCRSSSVPIALSVFGVSTFKGLLSIPCEGRGARRPLGQSFREPVGPAVTLYVIRRKCINSLLFD